MLQGWPEGNLAGGGRGPECEDLGRRGAPRHVRYQDMWRVQK